MRKVTTIVLLVAALAGAGTAGADGKAEAKRYFDAGVALLKAEDYRGAAASFEASVATFPTKTALFNLANCYKALQRYDEALSALSRLRRDFAGRLGDEMEAETAAIEAEIRLLVGTLNVEVDRPGATVLVGGREVGLSPLSKPVLLAPGDHEVTARLQGVEYGVGKARILPGQTQSIRLVGVASAAPAHGIVPPPPAATGQEVPPGDGVPAETETGTRGLPASFWVATSIGLVGLVGAGVSWGLYAHNRGVEADLAGELDGSRFDDYSWEDNCSAGKVFFADDDEKAFCDTEWDRRESEDKARVSLAVAIPSTAVFAIGGTLAIIFFAKSRGTSAAGNPVEVSVSPVATGDQSGLVLTGRF